MKLKSYSLLPLLISIILIFTTTNLTAQDYYPLEIGNRWDYKTHYWDFGGGGGDSSYHSVEVIGDSLFPNNKQYFVLSRDDLIMNRYVRRDDNYIYYYNSYFNQEDTIINLSAQLNTPYFPGVSYASSVELLEIDTVEIFGFSSRILRFRVDGLILRYINFSDKFGMYHLDSPGEPPGTTQWSTNVYYGIIGGEGFGNPVSVDETEKVFPTKFLLSQNYPNPFNPSTSIQYAISSLPTGQAGRQFVSLKVYDVLGNEIATLVNEEKPAGSYEVEFSVGQNSILSFSSGIYFYQLSAGNFVETKKMILLK